MYKDLLKHIARQHGTTVEEMTEALVVAHIMECDCAQDALYPIFCAWCRPKGKTTVTSFSSVPNSDGICSNCRDEELNKHKGGSGELH